jgi:2-polyprenyl-6-methoxyphenol hydroxylase-like FAD-dependent oxidoreductase
MKVLVSGAGIAGTTLAFWLSRHGADVTVVERAGAVRAGGYKVDIRGAAVDVVRRMGLLDDLRRLRTDVRGASVVNAAGRRVASLDADTFGGRVHDDAEVLRGDLIRVLYDATRQSVEYRFDDGIADLHEVVGGVRVAFDSGHRDDYDVVVGAEGMRSRTRQRVFGSDRDVVRDLGYYVSIFTVPNHLGLDRWELTYVGPGCTALVYSTARQTDAKAMFLFASEPLAYHGRDRAEQQQLLARAYAGQGWEVPRLIEAVSGAPDFYFDSLSQVHLDRWSAGRVALLGDAAYCASPASGQGTSLALVGAYVLAGELATSRDHGSAFAEYERQLRPFVARNQQLGPDNVKRMVLRTKAQVRVTMTMLALLNRLPGKDRMMAKMVERIHRAATAIELKHYPPRQQDGDHAQQLLDQVG